MEVEKMQHSSDMVGRCRCAPFDLAALGHAIACPLYVARKISLRERVAREIAERGIGRPWEDFSAEVTGFEIDQADLLDCADAALEASHHAELVKVLRKLVYGGGGHVWTRARKLLAKIGGGA